MTIQDILFVDIETVPMRKMVDADADSMELFRKKVARGNASDLWKYSLEELQEEVDPQLMWWDKAGLMAEFGKIVSISMGKINNVNKLYIRTITSKDEAKILNAFNETVETGKPKALCAHNGKEFDFPYITRRQMVNGIAIPAILNSFDKKPWEVNLYDTMQMWGATAWNYRISLELLAHSLGLPSPKYEMTGKKVADVFYGMMDVGNDELPFDKEENALRQIGKYNAGDVVTLVNCFLKMRGLPIIAEDKIEHVKA